jgi:hypothetical protein
MIIQDGHRSAAWHLQAQEDFSKGAIMPRYTVQYQLEKRSDGDWDTWVILDSARVDHPNIGASYSEVDALLIADALNAYSVPPTEAAKLEVKPAVFQMRVVR